VLVTRWQEFSELGAELKAAGRSPLVVDGRRVLPPDAFAAYEGIGREGMRT
jgi:UDPglucose 6-dehydrogenase